MYIWEKSGTLQHVAEETNPPIGTPESKSKNRIMLVDDEPDILVTFKEVLEEEGFKVDAFNDPHLALSISVLVFMM